MKNCELKVGDIVTIESFHPDQAWAKDTYLIGLVCEVYKPSDFYKYNEDKVNYLYPLALKNTRDNEGNWYPEEITCLGTVKKLKVI